MKPSKVKKGQIPQGKEVKDLQLEDFISLKPGDQIQGYFKGITILGKKQQETPLLSDSLDEDAPLWGLPTHVNLVTKLRKIEENKEVVIICEKQEQSTTSNFKFFKYRVFEL